MKEKPLDLAQVPCWRCIITQHLNLKNKLIKAGLMKKSDTQLPAEYYDGSAIFGSIWDNTPQQVKFINALKELQSTNKSSVPIYKPEAAKPIAKPHERTVFFPKIDTVNISLDSRPKSANKKGKEKSDETLMIIEDDNFSNTENTTSHVDASSKLAVINNQISSLNKYELNQLQTQLNTLKRLHTSIIDDNNPSHMDENSSEESDKEGGSVIPPLKKSKKSNSTKKGNKTKKENEKAFKLDLSDNKLNELKSSFQSAKRGRRAVIPLHLKIEWDIFPTETIGFDLAERVKFDNKQPEFNNESVKLLTRFVIFRIKRYKLNYFTVGCFDTTNFSDDQIENSANKVNSTQRLLLDESRSVVRDVANEAKEFDDNKCEYSEKLKNEILSYLSKYGLLQKYCMGIIRYCSIETICKIALLPANRADLLTPGIKAYAILMLSLENHSEEQVAQLDEITQYDKSLAVDELLKLCALKYGRSTAVPLKFKPKKKQLEPLVLSEN